MKIVGQISTMEEAKEMEFITKMFVVGNRARLLADKIKKEVVNCLKTLFFISLGLEETQNNRFGKIRS